MPKRMFAMSQTGNARTTSPEPRFPQFQLPHFLLGEKSNAAEDGSTKGEETCIRDSRLRASDVDNDAFQPLDNWVFGGWQSPKSVFIRRFSRLVFLLVI
jgi:hypothetical protein